MPTAEAKALLVRTGPESLTWLGHASFLLRTGGRTVLTDPFLSDWAGPLAGFGPKRIVPPGLPLAELPRVDVVVLSHNHYDHLDARSVEEISLKVKREDGSAPAAIASITTSPNASTVPCDGWS